MRPVAAWLQASQSFSRVPLQMLVASLTADAELLAQIGQGEPSTARQYYESINFFHWGYVLPGHLAWKCNPSLRIKCYLSLRIEPLLKAIPP